MTTDLVKLQKLEQAGATAGANLFRQIFGAPARPARPPQHFVPFEGKEQSAEVHKLVKLLEQNALEKEGRERCMSATVALLKYAHQMIDRAEDIIKAQESRINQLEGLVTTDDLTGIKNRRGFFEALVSELDKCERGISAGGLLILIDLDNFKAINDTYGHMAGDACLRLVAKTLANEVRLMDVAARLGGDEFVLLLSNTSKEWAAGRAQDLAWQLNNLSVAWHGEVIPVRASLGLRPYRAGDRPEKIFKAADVAMYASKRERAERKGNSNRQD